MKQEEEREMKLHSFDEAIDLTGKGRYNMSLLATMSLALLAMCIELFSMSVIVPLSSCDFKLDIYQKSILVSMPFLGPVFTAYLWGYISDTQGRRQSLIIGMWGGFVMSALSAFAPHWIVLAVLKFLSTCFCSCAQSGTFTLLGESCPEKIKGKYLLIMSSIVHQGMAIYFTLSFLIGQLDFAFDLGFVAFVPWRFLVLVLALPLGISGILVVFFYESPKFLLNLGREDLALDVLKQIHRRNHNKMEVYPVEKLTLNEEGNVKKRDISLLQSLLEQTIPLFQPPLLFRTLLMYYFILIVYSVSGSLYIWLPFLAHAFTGGASADFSQGLCSMIMSNNSISSNLVTDECRSVDLPMVLAALVAANVYTFLNVLLSKFATKKHIAIMTVLGITGACCFLTTLIPNWTSSLAYFGILSISLCMGPIFAYYVDLYPTSFRGMASCLGVMMARISSTAGINIVGPVITTYCSYTFYSLGVFIFSGALAALLLPKPTKMQI